MVVEQARFIQAQLPLRTLVTPDVHPNPEVKSTSVYDGIPGATYSQRAKYFEASEEAVESRKGYVTIYQPYIYKVTGEKEGLPIEQDIASRYAKIMVGEGKEVWFEVVGTLSKDHVSRLSYLTEHQIHIILGDIHSQDAQKFSEYTKSPREDSALVRLVSVDEIPLLTGIERSKDVGEVQQAAQLLAEQLIGEKAADTNLPKREDIEKSLAEQTEFEELITTPNEVKIGKPQIIEGTLDNSHARLLYVYPTISSDGTRSYLITNKELVDENGGQRFHTDEIIGRMDFVCGCQKFGDRALDHTCGHELLGSLKGVITPEDSKFHSKDPTIIIAWGGIDANGNGSVMHSLKRDNRDEIGLGELPERQADTGNISERRRRMASFHEIPMTDHRNFRSLAEVLWGTASAVGATSIRLNTANERKINALQSEARNMTTLYTKDTIAVVPDQYAIAIVPDYIRQREDRNSPRNRFTSTH